MAAQTSKTNIGGILRNHANTKVEMPQDFTRLPGGIEDGVAQLATATIGEYKTGDNKGQQFVRLSATVVEPKTALDVKKVWDKDAVVPSGRNKGKKGMVKILDQRMRRVEGLQTSAMFPLCDSGQGDYAVSADQNIKDMLNMLDLVAGADVHTPPEHRFTYAICTAPDPEAALPEALKQLEAAAPYIKFTTWQGDPTAQYPEPGRVKETWFGSKGLENYVPNQAQVSGTKTVNGVTSPAHNGQQTRPPSPTGGPVATTFSDGGSDLIIILNDAMNGSPDAQAQLLDTAVSLGIAQADMDALGDNDWDKLVQMIADKQSPTLPDLRPASPSSSQEKPAAATAPAASTGPDVNNPQVGNRFFYRITKNMTRGMEVEVTSVQPDGVIKAKNVANPRMEYTITQDRRAQLSDKA